MPSQAMLCLFLVLVHTAEDMVLLKRVNNRDNKLLESLRRKLMEDNFDYEHTSEPGEPSTTRDVTHSVLSEPNKLVPDIMSEASDPREPNEPSEPSEPSEFALSYQPQYTGRGEPLPEALPEPAKRRRAHDITDGDPVVYV